MYNVITEVDKSYSGYINGNYCVRISSRNNRTWETLKYGEKVFKPDFPDSIDLKLTNRCKVGCPYCHEGSFPGGKIFNLDRTIKVLSKLPRVPIELAIGGGDILCNDSMESVTNFIKWAVDYGFEVNGTINIKSFPRDGSLTPGMLRIMSLLDNVGISIENCNLFKEREDEILDTSDPVKVAISGVPWRNKVFHVILGIFSVSDLRDVLKGLYSWDCDKLLILGYKSFGRGKNMNPLNKELIEEYREVIKDYLHHEKERTTTIGFDNLALEQLDLKSIVQKNHWEKFYLGEEFTNSMYIDAVEETFAPTSRSTDRMKWKDISLLDYFQKYHTEWL